MTRMPMMLLLLLLSLLTPQILARATRSTSVTETIPMNEYTTNTGNLEWFTVTMNADSDIILTTEDGLEMSTHLSEDDNPTTEDFLRVKLQQEKDERHQLNPSTEAPKVMFTTEQTIESSTERLPKHALNKYNPAEDSVVEIEKLDTYIKAATFLPDMTTQQSINNDATFSTENSAGETVETTNWPPQEVESNSFRSNSFESISPSTDSANLAGNTWLPNMGDSVESTTEINMEHFMTTFMTDPESKLVDTGINNNRHIEDPLMNLLSMMSLNAFTEMAKLESEAELYSPEENKVELTTISAPAETTSAPPPKEQPNLQPRAESTTQIMEAVPETTIASPRELSFLESIILTPRAPETTTQSTTTSTTTEEVPIPTSSSTTTEEVPLASSSSTTTEEIPLESSSSTTTEEIPLSTTSTTTEEIPLASSSSTTTEEIPLSSSSGTTTEEIPISSSSSTTTEEIPISSSSITTTEEIPLASSSSITTEELPIPSSSSTTTEEIPIHSSSSTTTEEIPLPTTSTTTESTPSSTTSSTTTESIPIPSTSSTTTETVLMSTTSSTTTESIPITTSTTTESAPISTTTEVRLQATRAPRIERIFNSDGVEVLYGYSSVVRTNRL